MFSICTFEVKYSAERLVFIVLKVLLKILTQTESDDVFCLL